MISSVTGEVSFCDGLRITAHVPIAQIFRMRPEAEVQGDPLPIVGWHQYRLGDKESEFGRFTVEAVTDDQQRITGVFLSHVHPFYQTGTPEDSERRAFHEGILASELLGRTEFSWGKTFCRVAPEENRDWVVVIYSPFADVPLFAAENLRRQSTYGNT